MFVKDFRIKAIKAISAIAVIVILFAGFFNQTKEAIPFQPGKIPLNKSSQQITELETSTIPLHASESKKNSSKEAEVIMTRTNDRYITEGQRILSPDINMRDGFHLELGNKTTINYH